MPVCETCVPSSQRKMQIRRHFLLGLVSCVTLSFLSDHTPPLTSRLLLPRPDPAASPHDASLRGSEGGLFGIVILLHACPVFLLAPQLWLNPKRLVSWVKFRINLVPLGLGYVPRYFTSGFRRHVSPFLFLQCYSCSSKLFS